MRSRTTWLGPTIFITSGLALIANCSAVSERDPGASGGGGRDVGESSGAAPGPSVGPGPGSGTGNAPGIDIDDLPGKPVCGNGKLTDDEACDDGNTVDGDGCAADCHSVELGWSCPIAGKACLRIARCGDGVPLFPELCDDGNTEAGDGCSPNCKVEVGYKCDKGSPSKCTPTTCGDGVQEGAESCEDGNKLPFDGCSINCQAEPDCSGGACVSRCGDGLVLGEECDDGNNIDGDGCSSTCTKEPGYECTVPQPKGSMVVPVVFRDFRATHRDFEPGGEGGGDRPVFGMVAQQLNAQKKPVYMQVANSLVTSAETFAQWYSDVPGTNSTTATTLTLWETGNGRFVNRWGEDGEPWTILSNVGVHYCGNVGSEIDGEECTSSREATPNCGDIHSDAFHSCVVRDRVYWARYVEGTYDGNPLFFPVDNDPFTPAAERSVAKIPPGYGGNWQDEEGNPRHNFHFTSEIRYWFQYTAGQQYQLNFTGDDDVWVFINDRLAVDVGGIHSAVEAELVINAQGAGRVTYATEGTGAPPQPRNVNLGLQDGKVYQIAVFHAERKTTASTFKLTFQGFATERSVCTPICGDGIVSLGEGCDDGVNDGGYGECGPNCQLGEYCGDGIVQGPEQCDDGNNRDGDECGSGCRNLVPL